MLRCIIVTVTLLVSSAGSGFAQGLSVMDGNDRLQPIIKQLMSDARDLNAIAHGLSDCMLFRNVTEMETDAGSSAQAIGATQDVFRMYSLLSPSTHRVGRRVLADNMLALVTLLDLNVKLINSTIGLSLVPDGAAVLGTRVKDEIRAALEILERMQRGTS